MTDPKQHNGLRVSDLSQNSPTPFELRPDQAAMSEMAQGLKLSGLRKLSFTGQIRSYGDADWQLTGHLGATVIQPCVITLAPVTTRIEVDVERRFFADMTPAEGEEEVEMPEDETSEALGSHIDPAIVMEEALAMAVPAYPRKNDAELSESVFTEPGKVAMKDEDARPFAGLAALRGKLENNDDQDR